MANNIEATIQNLAHGFVQEIVKALVGASIEEFAQLATKGGGSRRPAALPRAPGRRGRAPKAESKSEAKSESSRGRKAAPSKRVRRTSEEIESLIGQVVEFVRESAKDHPEGVAVSEIASSLNLEIEDITRPIHRAVEDGVLKKKGDKRLTRYFPGKKREE